MTQFKPATENFQSQRLINLVQSFPDLSEELTYFDVAFDHEVAEKQGELVPSPGIEKNFDDLNVLISNIEKDLEKHRIDQEKLLKYFFFLFFLFFFFLFSNRKSKFFFFLLLLE